MSAEDRALLTSTNKHLKKVDLLPGLTEEVEALKSGMDYNNKMEEIRAENKILTTTTDSLISHPAEATVG